MSTVVDCWMRLINSTKWMRIKSQLTLFDHQSKRAHPGAKVERDNEDKIKHRPGADPEAEGKELQPVIPAASTLKSGVYLVAISAVLSWCSFGHFM